MRTTVDLRGLVHAVLTCVTAGPGLGFNRAILFLADDDADALVAAMAIGPATPAEAEATWARVDVTQSIDEMLRTKSCDEAMTSLQTLVEGLAIPIDSGAGSANPLLEAYHNRRVVRITNGALHDLSPRLCEVFGGVELVCVPLVAKDRSVGLIVADNAFTREPVDQKRLQLLQVLALVAGLALDNARIYEQVEHQAAHLQRTLDTLRTTQEQLIHSERLATVGAVVARVSHEIRNPLATIGGFARSVRAHPDEIERVARNAEIIVEEVEKLEALLKEMLDFTSPKPPTLEPTAINPLVTSLATMHRDELAERQVQLEMDLSPDLPAVRADRNQIQRAFLNLWRNALDAMEGSGRDDDMVLTVRTRVEGGSVKIAFSDTGCGISPDAMPHVFTPFFTTKPRGTGLGLAVVKKIIDDHNGTVEVRSAARTGTTFTIELPR